MRRSWHLAAGYVEVLPAHRACVSPRPCSAGYDVTGQEVRNHLIFLFNGGKGQLGQPTYSLTVLASAYSEATTTIIVNDQNAEPYRRSCRRLAPIR